MNLDSTIRKRIRPMLVWGGALPLLLLVWRTFSGNLGANPAEELEHTTGFTALWFLLGSLAMTPLRRLTSRAAFTSLRKPPGLWAFAYALLHLLCWLVFDQSLLLGEIWYDIRKRPYITVGFTAFLILAALAATTPGWMARRLGGKRWKQVHRLVYLAATLAVLHFLWLVKLDVTRPVVAGVVLIGLLALRLDRIAGSRPYRSLSSEG